MRGGGGGFFISRGGATNPGSPVPSPAIKVPLQRVAASAAVITFLVVADFIFSELNNSTTQQIQLSRQANAQQGKDLQCTRGKTTISQQ